ncbi:hypothetical protein, partial [Pseudophaeobacter arcticus]|uniref:hypothetical protein n=1 Tax=Pseudophaeobacter arcticus TaxID=385492 RepID=UPI0024916512
MPLSWKNQPNQNPRDTALVLGIFVIIAKKARSASLPLPFLGRIIYRLNQQGQRKRAGVLPGGLEHKWCKVVKAKVANCLV